MSLSHVNGKISLSQNCMLVRPLHKSVYMQFYRYHLEPLFRRERKMIPDHMQPSFRMEDFYSFYVAKPPFHEQKSIVDNLEAELNKLHELETEGTLMINYLKERKSALISAAVTGKIDVRDWQPPAGSDTVDSNASVQTERHYG